MARLPCVPSEPYPPPPHWGIAAQILIYWKLERFVSCHFVLWGLDLSWLKRRLKGRALGEGDALLSQELSARVKRGGRDRIDRETISQGPISLPCN